MSTKDTRLENVLAAKKPGEVGGPLVGYAEATRAEREAADVCPEVTDDAALATAEYEKRSGKSIGDMTEADFMRIPIKLMARNKAAMTELNVIFKDPAMTGRWFNHKHKDGMRVQQAFMMGFTPCTKDDVELCHARSTDENGSLVMGDLVLMKISKAMLWGGYYKDNVDKAKARVNKAMNDPSAARLPNAEAPQGEYFVPQNITRASHVDVDAARNLVYQD